MEKDRLVELRRAVSQMYQSQAHQCRLSNGSSAICSPLLGASSRTLRPTSLQHRHTFSNDSCTSRRQHQSLMSSTLSSYSSVYSSSACSSQLQSSASDLLSESSTSSTPRHTRALSPESDTSSSSSSSEANSLIERMTGRYTRRRPPKGIKSRVLYDFEGQGPNEITVHQGEFVRTMYHVDKRWIFIVNRSGQFGYIPFLYVTKYDSTCERRVPSQEKYRLEFVGDDEDVESSMTSILSNISDNLVQTSSPKLSQCSSEGNHFSPTVIHPDVERLCLEEIERKRDSASSDSGNFDGSSNSSSNSVATGSDSGSTVNKPLPVIRQQVVAMVHDENLQRPKMLKLNQEKPPHPPISLRNQPLTLPSSMTDQSVPASQQLSISIPVKQPSPQCTCPNATYEVWKRRPSFDNAVELEQQQQKERPVHHSLSTFNPCRQLPPPPPLVRPSSEQFTNRQQCKKVTFSKDNEIIGFADNIDRLPYAAAEAKSTDIPCMIENRDAITFYGDYVPDLTKTDKVKPPAPIRTVTSSSGTLSSTHLYKTMRLDDPDSSIDKYTLV